MSGQDAAAATEQQATQVAELFSAFAGQARKTLDVCIYDFRLTIPAVSAIVVKAINDAAERGVAVRVAYDENVLRVSHPGLANAYADYINGLVKRYKAA